MYDLTSIYNLSTFAIELSAITMDVSTLCLVSNFTDYFLSYLNSTAYFIEFSVAMVEIRVSSLKQINEKSMLLDHLIT